MARAADRVSGRITDPQGQPVAGAKVTLTPGKNIAAPAVETDVAGMFVFLGIPAGTYRIAASAPGFTETNKTVTVPEAGILNTELRFVGLTSRNEAVTVTADVEEADIQQPDPAQRVFVRDEMLDANPGRPGAPVSIPGLPTETASGGSKLPNISRLA